jgi:hypothetical protein
MNILRYFSLIILIYSISTFGQVYNGPSTGTVSSGVMVSTDNFQSAPIGNGFAGSESVKKNMEYFAEPYNNGTSEMKASNNYTYIEDANASLMSGDEIGTSFELHSFESLGMTNSIPPDPHMAVGPNHVMTTVNSVFGIYDREGNIIKVISADTWCSAALANPGAFDPQIIYDHYAGRWFMLWDSQDDQTQTAHFIISYSDDENPIGTWYMYALDATVNGSIPSNPKSWGDYPQVGYDDLGIYISSRDFYFAGGMEGANIRILDKSELYAANGGPLTFTDLWSIRTLAGGTTDDLHPTISYDAGNNTAYFMIIPNNSGQSGTYLYKITNPITAPVLSGVALGVSPFNTAPDARQLGGSLTIDSGPNGSGLRNAPIIRDDSLYAVHHIANTLYPSSGSIRYYVIDITTNTVVHEVEFGADGFHYIYPSIAVDKDHNVAITYTRSGVTEYAGSYYSTRLASDPQGFSPSKVMVEGKGYYYVIYTGTRNRWGDYLCAALDPVNQENIWLYSEYAAAFNIWGTWLTEIRMKPISGTFAYLSSDSLGFGDVEINTISDTLEAVIANYGTDDFQITSVASGVGPFTAMLDQTLPLTLHTYDSLTVKIFFSPTALGDYDEVLAISGSVPNITGVQLTGHCYEIIKPYTDVFYASSGGGNSGNMLTIDRETGVGTILGPSLFGEITSLAVNPDNDVLYGLAGGGNSDIVRVNADQGDAYTLFTLGIPGLSGIDFDTSGTLYASNQNGDIYTIDLNSGDYSYVTTSTHPLNAICFDPNTNQLYGALRKGFGNYKDSVYTIDLLTGEATPIGRTGFNVLTNDMTFDEDGKLYGVSGSSNQEGKLFEIDLADGSGTLIGTGVGFNHTTGLAFSINGPIVSVDGEQSVIPEEYSLKQNYPNPFNPTTKIEFSLPVAADVELVVYNILGQQVASLIKEQRSAGNYSIFWNADDTKGMKLSSGIYLYKLKATGSDGSEFQETRKMVLLK